MALFESTALALDSASAFVLWSEAISRTYAKHAHCQNNHGAKLA